MEALGVATAACARGASPHGYPNIIDITDERNPKIVSKLRLEVSDPANCRSILTDPPESAAQFPCYNEERCVTPIVANNPTMLVAPFKMAGLRVFDIRDLSRPKEIAYFKPPAVRRAFLPGSGSWTQAVDRTYDKISGFARFKKVPANGTRGREIQIWFVSDGNGFQVVRFSDAFDRGSQRFVRRRGRLKPWGCAPWVLRSLIRLLMESPGKRILGALPSCAPFASTSVSWCRSVRHHEGAQTSIVVIAMTTFMSRLSAGIVIAAAAGAVGVAQHTAGPTGWSSQQLRSKRQPLQPADSDHAGQCQTLAAGLELSSQARRLHRQLREDEAIPIVIGNTMYLGSPYGAVIALDATTGAEKWKFQLPNNELPSKRGIAYWPGGGGRSAVDHLRVDSGRRSTRSRRRTARSTSGSARTASSISRRPR